MKKKTDDTQVETSDAPATAAEPSDGNRLAWLGRALPTILVLGALATAGYWGHRTGWKIPAFSELTGNAPEAEAGWCAEHGVPASICVACIADLMPKGELHGWCKAHGVAECVWEHPDLAQVNQTPGVAQADLDRVESRPAADGV